MDALVMNVCFFSMHALIASGFQKTFFFFVKSKPNPHPPSSCNDCNDPTGVHAASHKSDRCRHEIPCSDRWTMLMGRRYHRKRHGNDNHDGHDDGATNDQDDGWVDGILNVHYIRS